MTLSRSWLHFTGLLLSLECVNKMERKEPTVLDCCLHLENYRYTVLSSIVAQSFLSFEQLSSRCSDLDQWLNL